MLSMESRNRDRLPKSVPLASHRHATPSGPWPWLDLGHEGASNRPQITPCSHEICQTCPKWLGYPQSHFPNWTPGQIMRCNIASAVAKRQHNCKIFHVDVSEDQGKFVPSGPNGNEYLLKKENERELWDWLQISSRPPNLRARALFIENMSGPALQILGASYNIEPFFFSSSLNWIPSRYQEDVRHGEGDHITITLTFLRTMPSPPIRPPSISQHSSASTMRNTFAAIDEDELNRFVKDAYRTEIIDTQAPLSLESGNKDSTLLLDILDLHMIRNRETSTIVSYHADPEWRMTFAKGLQGRFRLIGESVYWKDIFRRSKDPTFLLLAILWHVLHAWDEALEVLYSHICFLEGKVIDTNDTQITHELHIIRAHLLHYESLLEDFQKSVTFVLETRNPAMDSLDLDQKQNDRKLLEKESKNLLIEIKRLQMTRSMQDSRLRNVMNLVFSSVNLEDSKRMQAMTEAAVRDSEAMKQIAYLTMVFLPASFVAGIFGMNVKEINPDSKGTISLFFATALPLSIVSVWAIGAFQSKNYMSGYSMWTRFLWPIVFAKAFLAKYTRRAR